MITVKIWDDKDKYEQISNYLLNERRYDILEAYRHLLSSKGEVKYV